MFRLDARALLFATVVLVAGCVQPSTPQPDEPLCSLQDATRHHPCQAEGKGWVLRNVTTEGEVILHGAAGDALRLENVHLRNVSKALLELCTCLVKGKDFVIEGVGNESIVYVRGIGWHLDGLEMRGVASGLLLMNSHAEQEKVSVSNATIECVGVGIQYDHVLWPAAKLTLNEVRISGCEYSAVLIHGDPIGAEEVPSVEVLAGNFTDNGVGIGSTRTSQLSVRDSTFERNGVGILSEAGLDELLTIDVERSRFVGNGGQALAQGCGGGITGAVAGTVHDSDFVGNALAIHVVPVAEDGVAPMLLDATGNWWGSPAGPMRHAKLSDYLCPVDGGTILESVNSYVTTAPHKLAPG